MSIALTNASTACTLFSPCGCATCESAAQATPLSVANRPGLPTLAYRVGTFSTFRQAMLNSITLNPVANPDPANVSGTFTLTARASDDYGIAMLELWAYVCDVLTFYQQSIANQVYLRSASQDGAVGRVAALLGYRPASAVAASVYLAFLAGKNASGTVPAGLQTQSAPAPGQTSVVYEVSSPLAIRAAANQPVLLGPASAASLNKTGLLLVDDPNTPLTKGGSLLFFNPASNFLSEQVVDRITPAAIGQQVGWRGDLGAVAPPLLTVYRLGRTFRCFGVNAPAVTYVAGGTPAAPTFTPVPTAYDLGSASGVATKAPVGRLPLDAVYSGLGAGTAVVLEYQDGNQTTVLYDTLSRVAAGQAQVGPLAGSSTQITLASKTLPAAIDLRTITIYELPGTPLIFSATAFDQSAAYPIGATAIALTDATALQKGAHLLLTATSAAAGIYGEVVTVSAAPQAIAQSGVTLGYTVTFNPALTASYPVAQTTLYANVVAATQGKTQRPETLGSGDGSQTFQEFALNGNPVTYVPSAAAESGAASTLQVFVNAIQWTEIDAFYGHGPDDRIFVTRTGDDGTVSVRFGDGVTGQRLPTGTQNVTALYRAGAGSSGNVAADTITTLLQTAPGVQSVLNPLPAFGGADAESMDAARQNAPVSVLTLGRAVSLRDYEALALTYRGVGKARASWADLADRRGVALTVAASGDAPLGPLAQPLRDFLDDHRDPNVPLSIVSVTPVPFVFRATLHVVTGYLQSGVQTAARAALGLTGDAGYLSVARLQIGESIFQSKLIAVLQDVAGVDWVELRELSTLSDAGPLEAVFISPQQIATPSLTNSLEDFGVDLVFTGGVNDLQ